VLRFRPWIPKVVGFVVHPATFGTTRRCPVGFVKRFPWSLDDRIMATKYRMELVHLVVEKDVYLNQGVILRPGTYEGSARQDARGRRLAAARLSFGAYCRRNCADGWKNANGPSERIRYHQICEVRRGRSALIRARLQSARSLLQYKPAIPWCPNVLQSRALLVSNGA